MSDKPVPHRPDPAPAMPMTGALLDSRDLLGGGRRLLINHRGELYVLRETRQGKLLLTK